MTVWHFVAYIVGHVLGMATMALHLRRKWSGIKAERRKLEAYALNLGRPMGGPSSSVAFILEEIEAGRPVGVSRDAWFAEWFKEMKAKMQRDELT